MSDGDLTSSGFDPLISRLIDEEATDGEQTQLIELLKSEEASRRTYVEQVCLDSLLRETLGKENLLGLVDSVTSTPSEHVTSLTTDAPTPHRKRPAATRATIIGIAAGVTGVAAAMLVCVTLLVRPAVQPARIAAEQVRSQNNLKQIGLALHNHHVVNGSLPPAYNADRQGKPLLSWRVHLLPYLDHQQLYDQFHLDEPWDSEHNRSLIPLIPSIYRLPEDHLEEGHTSYLAIRSENGVLAPPAPDQFGTNTPSGISFDQVTDGTTNTIAIVEVTADQAVVWSRPNDYQLETDASMSGLRDDRPDGFLTLFLDGVVRFLPSGIDEKSFRNHCTRAGDELTDQ